MPANEDLKNKLNELKQAYLKSMEGKLFELKELAAKEADVNEVYPLVHKIAGTSGIYGLSGLSNLSNEFEIYLKELRNDNSLIDKEEFYQRFGNYINSVERIIGEE